MTTADAVDNWRMQFPLPQSLQTILTEEFRHQYSDIALKDLYVDHFWGLLQPAEGTDSVQST